MSLPTQKDSLLGQVTLRIFPDIPYQKRRWKRGALISFWVVLGLMPFSIFLVSQRGSLWISPRASGSCQPQNVRLTNVYSQGFSISYTTEGDCVAFINEGSNVFGADRTITTSQPEGDVTWVATTGTHHLTVRLDSHPASGVAEIFINSGGTVYSGTLENLTEVIGGDDSPITINLPGNPTYDPAQPPSANNTPGAYSLEEGAFGECPTGRAASDCKGAGESVCTADASLCCHDACYRPYPIWGEVKDDQGNLVAGALVYVSITGGSSNTLSTIAGSNGRWVIELANLHQVDASGQVLSDFSAYKTNRSASGGTQTPDSLEITVGTTTTTANLSAVTNTTTCNTTNTCSNRACAMELPSPICVTLEEEVIATPPSCSLLQLSPTGGQGGTEFTAQLTCVSGSSPFGKLYLMAKKQGTIVAFRLNVGNDFGFCNGVTTCNQTFRFFPNDYNDFATSGTYDIWLAARTPGGDGALETADDEACTDIPDGVAEVPQCGSGIKTLTLSLEAPVIESVQPNQAVRGETTSISVTGQNLSPNVAYTLKKNGNTITGDLGADPSPTSVVVTFTIGADAPLGTWFLEATDGTLTSRYPFEVVSSGTETTISFTALIQGATETQTSERNLRVIVEAEGIDTTTYDVATVYSGNAKYLGSFTLPDTTPQTDFSADITIWEPQVSLRRKFTVALSPGGGNSLDFSSRDGESTPLLAGDFNEDNKITLADFVSNQGIFFPFQEEGKSTIPVTEEINRFDVNGDGRLDILDIAISLINFSGLEFEGE